MEESTIGCPICRGSGGGASGSTGRSGSCGEVAAEAPKSSAARERICGDALGDGDRLRCGDCNAS